MRILLLYCTIIVLLLTACTKGDYQTNLIPDSIFVRFYADSLIASEKIRLAHLDQSRLKEKMDSLYIEYHLNNQQTYTTLKYHQDNIERWRDFYGKVVQRLELLQQKELH